VKSNFTTRLLTVIIAALMLLLFGCQTATPLDQAVKNSYPNGTPIPAPTQVYPYSCTVTSHALNYRVYADSSQSEVIETLQPGDVILIHVESMMLSEIITPSGNHGYFVTYLSCRPAEGGEE
jgi:hypothetical protein